MISGEGLKTLVKRLVAAASHKESIKALMSEISFSVHPSDAYQEWFDLVYLQRSTIQGALMRAGVKLPITDPVSIKALVYREADRGDWNGFTDALADAIQAELWKCESCRKKTMVLGNCPHCNGPICGMRHSRKGLGIIADDNLIRDWDGTRLAVDRIKPRVEIVITTIAKPQIDLFAKTREDALELA